MIRISIHDGIVALECAGRPNLGFYVFYVQNYSTGQHAPGPLDPLADFFFPLADFSTSLGKSPDLSYVLCYVCASKLHKLLAIDVTMYTCSKQHKWSTVQ